LEARTTAGLVTGVTGISGGGEGGGGGDLDGGGVGDLLAADFEDGDVVFLAKGGGECGSA